jgi:DNA invertase Pin-like site-specific DNA recombinase
MADMRRKGRSRVGEKNHKVKLSESEVIEIRTRYSQGNVTQIRLAQEYGIGETQVWRIIHNIKWKHLLQNNV